ncbi:MAG: NAD(P)H-hydrate dehydratase [Bacteroidaceae bacterium]|nr:NAD(P)H-hydrate dehydratase [Bacteroidaceae bacterium]
MFSLSDAQTLVHPRDPESHKGTYGHGLLIAGSRGMAGAAVMAARAALRSGIGLLTVSTPECNRVILQTAVPEAMVIPCGTDCIDSLPANLSRYTAIAIGPGLTSNDTTRQMQQTLMESVATPLIIDADALNNIAASPTLLSLLSEKDILTPHLGEYRRLSEGSADEFSVSHHLYLILKGHRTHVCSPTGEVSMNTTGNAGMATGGSGDVLTGILLGLRAQGYSAWDASRLGVFAHGLAGDLAATALTEIAMTATDLIRFLPQAWKEISSF